MILSDLHICYWDNDFVVTLTFLSKVHENWCILKSGVFDFVNIGLIYQPNDDDVHNPSTSQDV